MHDEERGADEAREPQTAVDRLDLGGGGMADGMPLGRGAAALDEAAHHPLDERVVLGVRHRERAMLAGSDQDVEELLVRDDQLVVGQKHLEAGDAAREGFRQLFAQHRLGGV